MGTFPGFREPDVFSTSLSIPFANRKLRPGYKVGVEVGFKTLNSVIDFEAAVVASTDGESTISNLIGGGLQAVHLQGKVDNAAALLPNRG